MLNLMKYEFRRMIFSKGVIYGGLLTMMAAFLVCYWRGAASGATITIILMSFATMVVLFVTPFEFTFLFDKDMNSRQGYLLLMVPQKSTTIVAAKLLVALLQSVVIYTLLFSADLFCEGLYEKKFGVSPGLIGEIVRNVSSEVSGVPDTVEFFGMLLVLWLFFACLGMFVTAIPGKGKMASLLGFAGFVAAIAVVFFLLEQIDVLFAWLKIPAVVENIVEWVYMLGIDVALFFGTAKLMDRKVSL